MRHNPPEWTSIGGGLVSALLAACSAMPGGTGRASPGEGPDSEHAVPEVLPLRVVFEPQDQRSAGALGPGVLVPERPAVDRVVARVGDFEIRESHVYDRLLEIERRTALQLSELLVADVVIAENATRFDITIDREEVDALVADQLDKVERQVTVTSGGRETLEQWIDTQFQMTPDEYREFLRLELGRQRYRDYVIRYLAMLEDRVQIRFAANSDKAVCEEIVTMVREGADFAALARDRSEDATSTDGGLMAPFGRQFRHPVAKQAFELQPGEVSEVFEYENAGAKLFGVVYCLRRMPGRSVPFAEAKETLKTGLMERPVSRFEYNAFRLQYCLGEDALNTDRDGR